MPDDRDQIIAAAQNVPHLLDIAREADPALFKLLMGPSAASIWATPVSMFLLVGAARYGLQWDKNTCAALAGAIVTVGTAIFHYLQPKRA